MLATDLKIEQELQQHEGGTLVVRLNGALDAHAIDLLEETLTQAMTSGCRVLYLDLHGVDYISSAGCGAIINARGAALEHNVDLRLVSPSICVRELFRMLGLYELLPFAA
jgi:anti-anti-sigma factor